MSEFKRIEDNLISISEHLRRQSESSETRNGKEMSIKEALPDDCERLGQIIESQRGSIAHYRELVREQQDINQNLYDELTEAKNVLDVTRELIIGTFLSGFAIGFLLVGLIWLGWISVL